MKVRIIILAALLVTTLLYSQQLKVDEMVFCTSIEERTPVGIDSVFSVDAERIYCYTKLSGSEEPTVISHVWYYDGEEKARIKLNVKASEWRTWSSKRMTDYWLGDWRVDIFDNQNNVLQSKSFKINKSEN